MDSLMCLGGWHRKDGRRFRRAEVYNSNGNQWIRAAHTIANRVFAAAACLNGHVYVTGGFDGKRDLKTAERHDPVKNKWRRIASMRIARSGHGLVAFHSEGDALYSIGGAAGADAFSSVERYDVTQNSWTEVAPLTIPRTGLSCCLFGVSP